MASTRAHISSSTATASSRASDAPGAHVRAGPEGQVVARPRAVETELGGVLVRPLVAVGRGETEHDPVARVEWATLDRGVTEHRAGEDLHRRVEPERLLDERHHERRARRGAVRRGRGGWRATNRQLPMRFRVVSLPATMRNIVWVRIARSERYSPSTSVLMKRVTTSSGGSAVGAPLVDEALHVVARTQGAPPTARRILRRSALRAARRTRCGSGPACRRARRACARSPPTGSGSTTVATMSIGPSAAAIDRARDELAGARPG